MPRRSNGRRSGGSSGGGLFSSRKRTERPTVANTPSRNTPAPASVSPPPAPVQGGGSMGGLGSVVAEGMAFGTGNAFAHRAVDAIVGPRVVTHEVVASPAPAAESTTIATSKSLGGPDACVAQFKAFEECLNSYQSEVSKCQIYRDMLSECRKNSSAGLSA